jgi:hypothetical protein
MKKEYGQNESEAITSNLNNQFFGRVASLPTAEYVSRLFGRKEQLVRSEGQSDNRPKSFDWGLNGRAIRARKVLPYPIPFRSVVWFIRRVTSTGSRAVYGTTVEHRSPTFDIQLHKHTHRSGAIPSISKGAEAEISFQRIVLETKAIVMEILKPAPVTGNLQGQD